MSFDVLRWLASRIGSCSHSLKATYPDSTVRRLLAGVMIVIAFSLAGCNSQPNQNTLGSGHNTSKNVEQLLKEADTLYQAKQYKAAKQIYLQVVDSEKFLPITYYRLGNIFYAEKNLKAAQKYYLESLKQKPQSIKTHYNIGNVYLRLAEFHLTFFKDNANAKQPTQGTRELLDS